METLAALGGGSFALASLVVGARLLLLAVRTGELPEFGVGVALFLMGGLGYPAAAVARGAPGIGVLPRVALEAAAMVCMVLGTSGIALFNWRVFRPGERGAARGVAALGAALVASFIWQAAAPGFLAAAENRGAGLRTIEALAGVSLAWAAIESTRYAVRLRRRLALGLADPLVADRVRLWSVAIVAALLLNGASQIAAGFGADIATWRYGGALIGPLGLVAALAMWLAFLPPARYRAYVLARASDAGGRPAAGAATTAAERGRIH
jgi:hypothetical protein